MANTFNTFPTRAAENRFPALAAQQRLEKQRKNQAAELAGKVAGGFKQAVGWATLEAAENAITLPALPRIYGGEPVTYVPREGHLRVGGRAIRATR